MIIAIYRGHTKIAALLLEKGADKETEIAALMLEKGADKDAKNNVSHCRHRSCVRMLLALKDVFSPFQSQLP